jgi:hypothetical protein
MHALVLTLAFLPASATATFHPSLLNRPLPGEHKCTGGAYGARGGGRATVRHISSSTRSSVHYIASCGPLTNSAPSVALSCASRHTASPGQQSLDVLHCNKPKGANQAAPECWWPQASPSPQRAPTTPPDAAAPTPLPRHIAPFRRSGFTSEPGKEGIIVNLVQKARLAFKIVFGQLNLFFECL